MRLARFSEAALLRVSNVRKVFESARGTYIALDGVSLTVSDGEFCVCSAPPAAANPRCSIFSPALSP
jgi:hypothetical protein